MLEFFCSNGAYAAGAGERAVSINPLPYEMQPGKIKPGQGKRARESIPHVSAKEYLGIADLSQDSFLPEFTKFRE